MRKLIFLLCLFLSACKDKPTLQGREFRIVQNGLEITLGFGLHDYRYYGKAVNSYYGTYQIAGDELHFITPLTTMYTGNEEDMVTEEVYLNQLEHVLSYQLDRGKLIMELPNQQRLELWEK